MEFPFPYTPIEPIVLTDLKNKLFANFYKFLTLPYNFYDQAYLDEYYPGGLPENENADVRVANPRREANKIQFDQAYYLAESMVDDIRKTFNHFKVETVPNAPYSTTAPDPLQWGPMGVN